MRGLYDCLEVLLRIALVVLLYMSNASPGSPRWRAGPVTPVLRSAPVPA